MGIPKRVTCKECGAPRDPKAQTARCTACNRRYTQERTLAHRAQHPGYTTEHSRLHDYARLAREAGAVDEVETAWLVMACEVEYHRGPRSSAWVKPFIAAELAYLRANAGTFAALDQRKWQPVKERETVTIDDGWTDEEIA